MKKVLLIFLTISFLISCANIKEHPVESPVTSTTVDRTLTQEAVFIDNNEKKETIVEKPPYNPSSTILTNLIHTKLEVSFNWGKSQLNGIATLQLSPHFYSTDSLILEAKKMDILSVKKDGKDLNYKYNDEHNLRIGLDRIYSKDEEYTVVIQYISKPEEVSSTGSNAITSEKGLYFINPQGENKNQMPQIWTQGEPESNSVWFPTFDKPNYKSTQEIYITVDNKYTTLSNGKLVSSTKNSDGTRTDYWKHDLPHAPYLFMLAIGEFSVVEDTYTKKDGTVIPVNYYVEPEWKEHAKAIFGKTPEMMRFFSNILGVDYPWDKYHQIVVREYVSGAMENTTASVYGDFLYQTKRELIDSDNNSIIAHELFHHWFGNLVTLESWANLPLNESFANYSQYLWDEYYNGNDEADYNAEKEKSGYFQATQYSGHHDLIWYDYPSKDAMFDSHSYNKGGRILHMLRNYLGDDAFFAGLKLYLETHAFKTTEAANLRMAFEEISGQDLNWFFNQWFLASHHPILNISQEIKEDEIILKIEQKQDLEKAPLYKIPMKAAVYTNNSKKSYEIVVDKNINYFTFPYTGKIENIIVDEDRVILGEFIYKKPRDWYLHQYYNAPKYLDRKEAITQGAKIRNENGYKLMMDALNDDFWEIRQFAAAGLYRLPIEMHSEVFNMLKKIVDTDENSKVRSTAILQLSNHFFRGEYENETREILYSTIEKDSSYLVISNSLSGLLNGNNNDLKNILSLVKKLENEKSSSLKSQIISIYKDYGDEANMGFMAESIASGDISGYDLISSLMNFSTFYKEQSIELQEKYFYVLEKLSNDGNVYVKAILPSSLINILTELTEKKAQLKSELEYLNGKSSDEKEAIQKQLDKTEEFYLKIMNLYEKSTM